MRVLLPKSGRITSLSSDANQRVGEVYIGTYNEVLRLFHGPENNRLTHWIGVCAGIPSGSESEEFMDLARKMFMFRTFNTIVVRDKIDVEAAHEQFLKIDEYRWQIPRDMKGATWKEDLE